jgi:hypothetical protein
MLWSRAGQSMLENTENTISLKNELRRLRVDIRS